MLVTAGGKVGSGASTRAVQTAAVAAWQRGESLMVAREFAEIWHVKAETARAVRQRIRPVGRPI